MTPQQKKLYDYLLERQEQGVQATLAEAAEHLGLAAKSGVSRLVDSLVEMGLVRKPDGPRARRLMVLPRPGALASVDTWDLIAELNRRGFTAQDMDSAHAG